MPRSSYLFPVGLISAISIVFVNLQIDNNLGKKLYSFARISPQFSSLKVGSVYSVTFDNISSICLLIGCTIILIAFYALLKIIQMKKKKIDVNQEIEDLNEKFIGSEYVRNELTKQCLKKIEELPYYNRFLEGLVAAENCYETPNPDQDSGFTGDESSREFELPKIGKTN